MRQSYGLPSSPDLLPRSQPDPQQAPHSTHDVSRAQYHSGKSDLSVTGMPHLDLPTARSQGEGSSQCGLTAQDKCASASPWSVAYVELLLRVNLTVPKDERFASPHVWLTLWGLAGNLVGIKTGRRPRSCALPVTSSSGDIPDCNIPTGRYTCAPPAALPAMRDISIPQTSPTPGLRRISVCFRPCASELLPGLLHQLAVSNIMDPRGAQPDYQGFQNQMPRTEDIIKQRSVVENGPHMKISRQELRTKLCFGICIDKCHGAMRAFHPSGSCLEYYPGTSVVSLVRIGIQASESQVCDIAECFESH